MNTETIENKLKKMINDLAVKNNYTLQKSIDNFSLDDDLQNVGLNSIAYIQIIVSIEIEFDIELDIEHLNIKAISTFRNLIGIVENELKK